MVGHHNAENIKKMIELIVNRYDFDRSKIKDIGSDFDNEDESDNDDEKVDNELRVIIKDMNSISIPIVCLSENEIEEFENLEVENVPENEYLIENDRGLFEDLVIELDDEKGTKISRYYCACHKCNSAVRKAIKSFPRISNDFVALNSYAASIRKSNRISEIF
ncbi:unnamed protein product [Brachionus calyciflorus]|uniref:Uncharacterized protein n=1 Tax=Brachionus calyciflorus TaxID=104777 RepID=A0A814E9P2_9BILA|nr:unnamed protein product [Brachionus calyciflorus]